MGCGAAHEKRSRVSQRLPRFFVDGVFEPGHQVELRGGDAHRLRVVLRAQAGGCVEIIDSSASTFEATIVSLDASVVVRLDARQASTVKRGLEIVLAQAVPKGSKMDFVVEKATELGVARIVPLMTEHTLGGAERDGKLARWRRLAEAAAKQCGRTTVPSVEAPAAWADFVPAAIAQSTLLVPWELAPPVPLNTVLPSLIAGRAVTVAIGPEGGLTHDEVEVARAAGAAVVSLGSRILRTETAGLVAVSALRYAAGEL
jgi:16S rRNA (uracil1498-N3)-methyltransferase